MKVLEIRSFIEEARKMGILREIIGADWDLEIGAITDLNAKTKKFTLLFDEIKGYPEGYRVLTGTLLDAKRVGLALGLSPNVNDMELVNVLKEKLKYASINYKSYKPHEVTDAPFFREC